MEGIDGIYILKDGGSRLYSKTVTSLQKDDKGYFDDIITGFFSAIRDFAEMQLDQDDIEYVQFASARRLYYKSYKIHGHVVRFVILTARMPANGDPFNRFITSKSIEIKWIVEGLSRYLDTCKMPSETECKKIDGKIDALFS